MKGIREKKNTILNSWRWIHIPSKFKLKPCTIRSVNEFTSHSHVQAHNLKRWVSLWQEDRRVCSLYISPHLTPPWTGSTRYHTYWTVQNWLFFFKGSPWELQLEFTFPLTLGCYKFYYKQSQKQRTKQNYNLLLFSWEAGNELWHNDLNQFLIKLTYFREHTLTKHI